jgi:ubiquitin-conjugating enzyme E2 variant
VVLIVREHHVYPQRIFNYKLLQDVGILSWFGFAGVAPLYWNRRRLSARAGSGARFGLVSGLTFSVLLTLSLEFHKMGHRTDAGKVISALQRSHLVLSPRHHLKHHSREHDSDYCLVNGIGDLTLGRLGLYRLLEVLVGSVTGLQPRSNDRIWRRRFGRWVSEV